MCVGKQLVRSSADLTHYLLCACLSVITYNRISFLFPHHQTFPYCWSLLRTTFSTSFFASLSLSSSLVTLTPTHELVLTHSIRRWFLSFSFSEQLVLFESQSQILDLTGTHSHDWQIFQSRVLSSLFTNFSISYSTFILIWLTKKSIFFL